MEKDLDKWLKKYKKLNDQFVLAGDKVLFRERRGAQPSTEEVRNVIKCAKKGFFDTRLSLKDSYTNDGVGAQTGLPSYHKLINTASNENFHGTLNRKVVSQAPRVGPGRGDRELAYMVKFHNDRQDERRGLRKHDFLWGRSWVEEEAQQLWTNIDGPHPGGNQRMPRPGAVEHAKGGNPAKEVFGHEYLARLPHATMEECAKKAGLSMKKLREKKAFVAKPVEDEPAPVYDDYTPGGQPVLPVHSETPCLASAATPFAPTAPPTAGSVRASPTPSLRANLSPLSPSPAAAAFSASEGGGGARGAERGAVPDRQRLVNKRTDVLAQTVTPTTEDEIRLFDRCWSLARAQHKASDRAYEAAAYNYNMAVCENAKRAGEVNNTEPVLKLLGSVTSMGLRKYWDQSTPQYRWSQGRVVVWREKLP